jgi:hypothetical protein
MADDLYGVLKDLRAALNELSGNDRWASGDAWLQRSQGACDNATMKAIIEDNRRGGDIHGRASVIPKASKQSEEPQDRSGWREATPIKPPEGVALVDKLVDAQDRLDAVARAHQMGLSYSEWQKLSEKDIEARKAQQKLREKGPKT